MEKPKCPECTSMQVFLRIKSLEFVCRGCGHIWPKEAVKVRNCTPTPKPVDTPKKSNPVAPSEV